MIYNILNESLKRIWPSLVIVNVIVLVLRICYQISKKEKIYFYKEFFLILSVTYLLLLYELVTRVDYNTLGGGVNIIPFQEISRYSISSELFLMNVIGNIALFIPFGFIINTYFKTKKVWTTLISALIVSTTIEFVQKQIGRSFDIDDILLNTIGCIIGFLIYKLYSKIPENFKKTWIYNLICVLILVIIVLLYFYWGNV